MDYGLIGCGRIAENHIAAAQSCGLNIVALCDIDEEKMQRLAERFKLNAHLYKSYDTMLKKEKLSLVAVATPSGSHAVVAVACIDAGCNVIIEKPVALSLHDADHIIEVARWHNVVACACHQNRFNKAVQRLRGAVEQGRFGKLYYGVANVRWNRGEEYYKQAPWRGTYAQDGGALMNQCIHNIDLLRWLMGDEVSSVCAVTANLAHPFIEVEDLGLAVVRFKNGSFGIIEGTTNIYPKNMEETLAIFGATGTAKAGGKSLNILEEWCFADNSDEPKLVKQASAEESINVYGAGHKALYADALNAIENNVPPYVTLEAGRRALELVLAIYHSAATGRWVKLPLKRGDCSDFH